MSRRHRRKKELVGSVPELSMTPLIDVAWTLLVIFIITSPVIHHSIKINLPKGQVHEVKSSSKNSAIFIDRSGNLYFNGTQLSKNKLLEILNKLPNKKETLFIQADAAVLYGTVIELIDEIKRTGITHVAMATKKTG